MQYVPYSYYPCFYTFHPKSSSWEWLCDMHYSDHVHMHILHQIGI